jgi:hypothetical protein
MTDYLGDDPGMDQEEYKIGSMMRLADGTIGEVRRVGSSNTPFAYLLRVMTNDREHEHYVYSLEEIQEVCYVEEVSEQNSKSGWVIATFGASNYMVSYDGIAVQNYQELAKDAEAFVLPLEHALMMRDLGMSDDGDGTITISLDDEDESEEEEPIHSHNFFTCPESLQKYARPLIVNTLVTGSIGLGLKITGKIVSGHWGHVTIKDSQETTAYIPVEQVETGK